MIDFINGVGYIIEQGLDSQCLMLLAFLSIKYGSIELFKLCMCFETADCAVFDELIEDLTRSPNESKVSSFFLFQFTSTSLIHTFVCFF